MKKRNSITLIMTMLLSLTLASCGSDNKDQGAGAGAGPSSAVHLSTVNNNEGNVQAASDLNHFRTLVQNGNFAKIQAPYCSMGLKPAIMYTMTSFDCQIVTKTSDFLFWDDVLTSSSMDCDDVAVETVTERVSSGDILNGFGSNKVSAISNLLNLIDTAESKQFSRNQYGENRYRMGIVKGGKVYHVDLKYPIAANPVLIEEYQSQTVWSGKQATKYNVNCQSY